VKKIIRIKQSDDALELTWIINNVCPNRCSYCPAILHNGTNHNYEWKNAKKFLKTLLSKYPKVRCSIGGGEPTMSPFLPELIDMIHEHGGTVTLTSNGYRTPEYWKDIAPKLNWIGLSYHSEFPTEKYFENLNTVKYLTHAEARVMMLAKNWDQCVDVYERLSKDDYHRTSAIRIYNWLGDDSNGTELYTDKQLEWFYNLRLDSKNKYEHIDISKRVYTRTRAYFDDGTSEILINTSNYINNGQTRFKGYICQIGLKSLYVDQYGDVKRGNCMQGGNIGNINRPDEISWPTAPVVCSYDACTCGTDVRINKRIN
jgi:MoaA/NifB/PqqE/SkfB family radical SAM enzyme